ncbi:MAG: hypothetical protein Nkreftii_000462 [Candidatus Nitrospira kreftii]|uniref:Membrane-fusion protein n=1 Tax=Candidatus Nitrospira kreftii TaxID=2652173 RepID=A0A7S8IXY6_9BACT|nr:MAG: hypothetical protein Nkreftii_000462 [Candidatus Nitrospira kreftii]
MDLPGEKLVIKLWETLVEKGVGSLLSPWQAGREGRARNEVRRQELLMLAQAEKDAADIRAGKKQLRADGTLLLTNAQQTITPDGIERIEPTLSVSDAVEYGNRAAADAAARAEINVSRAILFAEDQLAYDTQTPPTRDIDEDWFFVWREYAGKVSAQDLQRLWGSVLAGEVKAPGKYSIRTLEFLKTLSKPEAEMISRLASYVIAGCVARNQSAYLDTKGLNFGTFLVMQELGVVSGVEAINLTNEYKSVVKEKFLKVLASHNKALIVEHDDPTRTLEFEVYVLTAVGRQILGLGSFEPDVKYMRLIGKEFVEKGFIVKLADWSDVSDTQGRYFNSQEIVADLPPTEA